MHYCTIVVAVEAVLKSLFPILRHRARFAEAEAAEEAEVRIVVEVREAEEAGVVDIVAEVQEAEAEAVDIVVEVVVFRTVAVDCILHLRWVRSQVLGVLVDLLPILHLLDEEAVHRSGSHLVGVDAADQRLV